MYVNPISFRARDGLLDDLEVELAVVGVLEGGLEGGKEFLVGPLVAGPGVALEGDVIGVGVERGVELLQLAEPAVELAVEGGDWNWSQLIEELAVDVGELGLGQEEPAQVPLSDRQGALAVVDSWEPGPTDAGSARWVTATSRGSAQEVLGEGVGRLVLGGGGAGGESMAMEGLGAGVRGEGMVPRRRPPA